MPGREPTSPPEGKEKKIHVLCATCWHYQGIESLQYRGTELISREFFDPKRLSLLTPFVRVCNAFHHPGGIPDEILFSKHGHRRRVDGDHDVQYEPRFPILFTSLDGWREYNWWATQLKLPDGRSLYTAWKPVAEKTIEYFLYAKTENARAFLQKFFLKLKGNVRKKYPHLRAGADDAEDLLQVIGQKLDLYTEIRERHQREPQRPLSGPEHKAFKRDFGLSGVVLEFGLRVRGLTLSWALMTEKEIEKMKDSEIDEEKFKMLSLKNASSLLFEEMECPELRDNTIKILHPKYKNKEGAFRLRLLSNGFVYIRPKTFGNYAYRILSQK